jgi:hypothetical protein
VAEETWVRFPVSALFFVVFLDDIYDDVSMNAIDVTWIN